jgi:hypothetical protein
MIDSPFVDQEATAHAVQQPLAADEAWLGWSLAAELGVIHTHDPSW